MNDAVVSQPGSLVGQPVSVLDTPALIVDLDVIEKNIARIAAECRKHGVNWRPHVKGNKTVEIVRKEIGAGAIGITCAKIGEAQVMADAGVRSILIANEIVGTPKIARLVALQDQAEVIVGIDSVANASPIAAAAAQVGKTVPVVIEVNVGMNRAGVAPGAAVVELADAVAKMKGLRLVGLMAWESHACTIEDPAEKERVVAEALKKLTDTAAACRKAGHRMDIVSCGGSGTFPYCIRQPGITEVQMGGAIFSDVHYTTHYHLDFPPALRVLASVTSRPTPTRVILDAGKKTMSSDAAAPCPQGIGAAASVRLSAEHATVEMQVPSGNPAVGDKVEFVVGYGDTTVHLHEEIVAVRAGRVEAIWKVAARGRIK